MKDLGELLKSRLSDAFPGRFVPRTASKKWSLKIQGSRNENVGGVFDAHPTKFVIAERFVKSSEWLSFCQKIQFPTIKENDVPQSKKDLAPLMVHVQNESEIGGLLMLIRGIEEEWIASSG